MNLTIGTTTVTHLDTQNKHLRMILRVHADPVMFTPEEIHQATQNKLDAATKYLIDEGFIIQDGKKDWITDVLVQYVR